MTSRRSRIKGIANIPQRRKPVNQNNELEVKEVKPYEDDNTLRKEFQADVIRNSTDICEDSNVSNKLAADQTSQSNEVSISNDIINEDNRISQINADSIHTDTINDTLENDANKNSTDQQSVKTEVESPVFIQNLDNNKLETPNILESSILKKDFVKIPVSLNASKKISVSLNASKKISFSQNDIRSNLCNASDNNDQNLKVNKKVKNVSEHQNVCPQVVHIAEEVVCPPNIAETCSENTETVFQKPLSIVNNTTQSDTEYSLPPPSPNKINRARIKATPRLAHRKASFSASESEDENRKIDRIRNDSVCSITSLVTDPITECLSPQRISTIPPKRSGRSEQTRKLAEARREFIRRFGSSKPERNRLTMMDLIFYNPDSNPMTTNEKDAIADDPEPLKNPDDLVTADNVDNSSPTEDLAKSDEENAMPVPQIKIGPSGEIILDEQSLVIERKDVQRQRAEMEKTKIVDADKFKTDYGIYTKHRRSKYWSHFETLRFYKALNTIGTDFMLMCELFPNRARRELKIKFKKEEKINRHLVDRALMQPCNFDFEDLKNELEMEEMELVELRKQKEEQRKQKDENIKKNQQKIIEKSKKRKAEEMIKKQKPIQPQITNDEPEKVIPKVKPKKSKKAKLSIKSFMSDSDADESDLATQSESDEDILLSRKPTRSGRLPKIVQRYEHEQSTINYVMKKNKIPNHAQPNNVEPGSIMIITEDGPNGEPVYKIYMVTPEQKATRLELSTDVIANVLQAKKGVSTQSIMTITANITDDEEECPQENNVTIPADENVTTLKSNANDVNVTIPEEVRIPGDFESVHQDQTNQINSPIVIATEKDVEQKEDLMIMNDLNEGSQIVLEVKSDGTCFKLDDEDIGGNVEHSVSVAEDQTLVIQQIDRTDCGS